MDVNMNDVFTLDGHAWQLRLDGEVLPTTWNSKGAALAAIPIERKRAARRRGVRVQPEKHRAIKSGMLRPSSVSLL